jgi:predicted GNAT family acetyltransferase
VTPPRLALLPRLFSRRGLVRPVARSDLPDLVEWMENVGPHGVLAGARVVEQMRAKHPAGEVWAAGGPGAWRGACWYAGTLLPVGFAGVDLEDLAQFIRGRTGGCASMVGDAEVIGPLWDRLSPHWRQAREIRPDQLLMELVGAPTITPDPAVRPARPEEADLVLPAAAAMFTEELGFPPPGREAGYRARVNELIRQENTFIRIGPLPGKRHHGVQFKADLGATIGRNVQIHGVWTHPDLRGQGLARHGLATALTAAIARGYTSISLYVNSFNTAAIAVYRALGFVRIGTWSTVMF